MSRNVTLPQLRADIAAQADITVASGGRYSPTLINRLINQSFQRFRERVSSEGIQHYLTSTSGNLTAGATSPWAFGSLDLSAKSPGVVRVYGVDINVNGDIRTLDHVPFNARNNYGGPSNTGIPVAWANYQTAKLALMPAPAGAYAYTVWYLPVASDLIDPVPSGGSEPPYVFDGVAGWEDYITWDVTSRLITKDAGANAFQMAEVNKQQIWSDILRNATRVTSAGGAVVGRDSLGSRASTRSRRLPPP